MDDVGETIVLQALGNELHTGAVNRSVDDFEVAVLLNDFGTQLQALDSVEELAVNFLTNHVDARLVAAELDVAGSNRRHARHDVDIVRSNNLRTVAPVSLIAVILLGIMAGSDVHTALAAEFADCKRQFGGGTETVEKINGDAVGREHVGNDFGKLARIIAHVIAHGNLDFGQLCKSLVKIIGQALGCSADCIAVHAVSARAHDAAQTARAEFKILVKALDQFGRIFGVKHSFHVITGELVVALADPFGSLGTNLFNKLFVIFHLVMFFWFRITSKQLMRKFKQYPRNFQECAQKSSARSHPYRPSTSHR